MVLDQHYPDARQAGQICGVAMQTQRVVEHWACGYEDLIESTYIAPVTTAFAFAWPWLTSDQLLVPLQFELWVFAADKAIDTDARTQSEVEDIVNRLNSVVDGAQPAKDDVLSLALFGLVKAISSSRLWNKLAEEWITLFHRTFTGMVEEWVDAATLAATGQPPTFDKYLANSDSCGFRIIRLTEWICSQEQSVVDHFDRLMDAAWNGEMSSRLTNDLRTHEREKDQIDLNAVKIGVPEEQIRGKIQQATRRSEELLGPLLSQGVHPAMALTRILEFGNGFYEKTDFRPPVSTKGVTDV